MGLRLDARSGPATDRRTRRARLGLVLAVIVGSLAMPALPALGSPPRSEMAELAVGGWTRADGIGSAAADTADAWWTAPPVAADDVVMVGMTWADDTEREVEVRTRSVTGRWGEWTALEAELDEGPDLDSDEGRAQRTGTWPHWIGNVDQVQIRTRGAGGARPEDVRVQGVRVAGGQGLGFQPDTGRAGAANAATAAPTIVPRVSWDPNGDCTPREAPSFAREVRFGVVHHTAGRNDYTAAEADDVVRATCLYHRNSRGWDDIGYNFLIDKYGRTYEGRAGGATEPVIGAHASGFNSGSFGVSMLGDLTKVEPSSEMVSALDRLLAWKLDLHHIDPAGTTLERAGSNPRWPTGTEVTINTLTTHGEVGSTSCPGSIKDWVSGTRPAAARVASMMGARLDGGLPAQVEQPLLGARPVFEAATVPSAGWDLTITNAAGATVRAGSGQGAVDLAWDLRDSDGSEVPPGDYTARLTSGAARPIVTSVEVLPPVLRIAGSGAAATGIAQSQHLFDDPRLSAQGFEQTEDVVIAPQSSDIAALAAPLAASRNAPLLVTPSDRLPSAVSAEVRRLGATEAYLVGDTTELSGAIESDLKAAGVTSITRYGGESRYHTSGRAGYAVVERDGSKEAVIALGEGPNAGTVSAELVAAAAYAGTRERALLLVTPTDITEQTQWVLEQRSWDRVLVVGGSGVLDPSVVDAIQAAAGGAEIVRLAGADRYATSKAVADELWRVKAKDPVDPNDDPKGDHLVLLSGAAALEGIPALLTADLYGAYPLLVAPEGLAGSGTVPAFLEGHADTLVQAFVAGNELRLPAGVVSQVESLLRSAGPHTADVVPWPAGDWPFDDVLSSPHRQAIERLHAQEITTGCAPRAFCPRDPVTRAQMATFLVNALALAPLDEQKFEDVPPGGIHYATINALAEAEITGGYPDGLFHPVDPVTRAQMATFIATAMGLEPVHEQRFGDVPPGGVHAGAINALVDAGIANGYSADSYGPSDPVTREQMASFIDRMLQAQAGEG